MNICYIWYIRLFRWHAFVCLRISPNLSCHSYFCRFPFLIGNSSYNLGFFFGWYSMSQLAKTHAWDKRKDLHAMHLMSKTSETWDQTKFVGPRPNNKKKETWSAQIWQRLLQFSLSINHRSAFYDQTATVHCLLYWDPVSGSYYYKINTCDVRRKVNTIELDKFRIQWEFLFQFQ